MANNQKVYNHLLNSYEVETEDQGNGIHRQVVKVGEGTSQALRLDDVGSGVTYLGYASPGVATTAASWQIKKMTETGDDLAIEWADGDALFDNIWDNRLSLSYS